MISVDELFANENQVDSFAEFVSEVVGVRHGVTELRVVFQTLPSWVKVTALAEGIESPQFREDARDILLLLREMTCSDLE